MKRIRIYHVVKVSWEKSHYVWNWELLLQRGVDFVLLINDWEYASWHTWFFFVISDDRYMCLNFLWLLILSAHAMGNFITIMATLCHQFILLGWNCMLVSCAPWVEARMSVFFIALTYICWRWERQIYKLFNLWLTIVNVNFCSLTSRHQWSSCRIVPCHGTDSGLIPSWCMLFQFLLFY